MNIKKIILISGLTIAGFAGAYFVSANTHLFETFFYNEWRPMGPGFYRGHMMMGGGIMHFIFWLILLYFLFSTLGRRTTTVSTPDSAVEILKKKYVTGDIDEAEYADKIRHLKE